MGVNMLVSSPKNFPPPRRTAQEPRRATIPSCTRGASSKELRRVTRSLSRLRQTRLAGAPCTVLSIVHTPYRPPRNKASMALRWVRRRALARTALSALTEVPILPTVPRQRQHLPRPLAWSARLTSLVLHSRSTTWRATRCWRLSRLSRSAGAASRPTRRTAQAKVFTRSFISNTQLTMTPKEAENTAQWTDPAPHSNCRQHTTLVSASLKGKVV